uniref:NOI n=1 Tax=Solanum tuberosum TaxID=4113 RepID=M1AY76_SOLTU
MEQEKGRPLPKFGEWDVNNPASADGFTVIFAKARDDKKANSSAAPTQTPRNDYAYGQPNPYQQETRDVSVAVNYESLRPSGIAAQVCQVGE